LGGDEVEVGDALLLPPLYAGIAVVAHFFLGALMTFGIGLFGPGVASDPASSSPMTRVERWG